MKTYSVRSSYPLCWGAPFEVGDRVSGAANLALVTVAGTQALKGKWQVDSERRDSRQITAVNSILFHIVEMHRVVAAFQSQEKTYPGAVCCQ